MTDAQFDQSAVQARQVDAIYQQAMDVFYQHPDQAAQLFEQAIQLAQTGAFTIEPYRTGLASSLAGLARLNMETQPDLSARCCLQILSLMEGYPAIPALVQAKSLLGWIYFHLGDYSAAMEWALKALNQSRELALSMNESAALDLMANVYGILNEFPQALSAHEAALRIAKATGNERQEANFLNNMAMTQVAMGQYATALEASQKSLRMFEEQNSVFDIVNSYDTLAQAHLGLGDYQQAEADLLNGLQILETIENQLLKTYLLKNLGRVYLAQNNFARAIEQTERALALARQNGLRRELAECHQLLASIYEQQADYSQALQHFKQFFEINQEIAGDTASKRLAILNVIHAVENAQHEAEIYRLRNIELQSEIDERKRVQSALEELATTDPLTSLFNRRYFLEKCEQEYQRALRYGHPIAVMMLDLDHFKLVNDTYGHAIGDQVLTAFARRLKDILRIGDIAGRMGGEEFALLLPETARNGAIQAAERLCKSFSDEPISIHPFAIRVTVSIGLTSFLPGDPSGSPAFETLLQQADQALYKAKDAGRNQARYFGSDQ